uniref:Uncharacterized protein n=1 Tax=Spongospora subterranea TaxID=70186 RepID=A0A0H5RDT5_9EUKA|eukprot:CRZ06709.1 hypothetical protein [Spongospora subterranea]
MPCTFLSSAERLNRNYSVVGKHDNGQFMAKFESSSRSPSLRIFDSAIEELQSENPNATKWFEWWLRDAVARLIFACKSCTDKEFEEMARSDSNPIESMHSTFYQIADRKNSLVYGMSILTMFSESLRQDFEDVASGVTVHYGQAERWKKQIEKYARKAPVVIRNRKTCQ